MDDITILEGTWEEIRAHDAELAGKQVRLEVANTSDEASAWEAERLAAAERFRLAREEARKIEADIPYRSGFDSVAMIREARAGAMYGYPPEE